LCGIIIIIPQSTWPLSLQIMGCTLPWQTYHQMDSVTPLQNQEVENSMTKPQGIFWKSWGKISSTLQ
jgi:hypothetical protein